MIFKEESVHNDGPLAKTIGSSFLEESEAYGYAIFQSRSQRVDQRGSSLEEEGSGEVSKSHWTTDHYCT